MRYQLDGRGELQDFKAGLIDDDPEAAEFFAEQKQFVQKEVVPVVPDHLIHVWNAWSRIHDDRFRDGFGNVGSIYYATISQYGRDFGYVGEAFSQFIKLISAMDDEYLIVTAEKRKATAEVKDNGGNPT